MDYDTKTMLRLIQKKRHEWQTFKAQLKKRSVWQYWVVDTVEIILVAVIMALTFREFVLQTSMVPTGSMIPTLNVGDRLFVNKFIYRFISPKRGDIVVFSSPFDDGKDYVKRCVALPGETLEIEHGDVYINGKLISFPGANIQSDFSFFGPQKIPNGHYFMMGDNRANSFDSRYWGFVPKGHVLGKALFTFWPLCRMRPLD